MPTPFRFPHRSTVLVLALFTLLAAGCDSSDPEPTTGSISGSIALPAGAAGDIVNTRVSLYETLDEFRNNAATFSTTASAEGAYTFENINPDSYFLAAFKDNDNSGDLSSGDFYGYLGGGPIDPDQATPQRQQVVAGQNTGIDFVIQIVPPGFGISVTGTYSGSSQGATLTMTLTDTDGSVTGSGTLNDGQTAFPLSVTGSRNDLNVTLQISSPQLVPLTFTGTLADDGSRLTGTLTGTGQNGPISIPFTLDLQ